MPAWIPLSEKLPPEGQVVLTKIDDDNGARNEAPLKRQGNLWFVEDGSMYVYYRPTHWTNANAANSAAILPSSLSARHTAGRGDGFILPGRLNRVGPGVGEVPTSRPGIIFRQRVLPVVFLASATAAVCAGTWRYWATFHKDDSSFLGFFGVALCCGSLATHFANERRAA